MTVDPRSPCIVGVAQRTVHPGEGPSPEPLDLWDDVCRRAAGDALGAVDTLKIVYCQSWRYDDPPGRLAQRLVNDAAEAILRGDTDVALLCGAEALETVRQAKKAGERLDWSHKDPEKKPFPFEAPFHPAEVAHNVFQAWLTFTVWDVARRARLGVSPADYRRQPGELMAPMAAVAARNPYAWFPVERDVDELIEPRPDNRMVGYPYTKYMVSIMDVDMAAAIVVASEAKADELGVPRDQRVYLRGWAYAVDPTYVAEHPDMSRSPAMVAA